MRSPRKLECAKCGERVQPEDTAVIRIAQPRYEERKHCCPRCGALIAIEIGPSEATQRELPALDQADVRTAPPRSGSV